jgi:uncharacterized membrane protein (GlpM family)
MIYLRLLAAGGVVALLLWGMEDKRWIQGIDFLFPFFTLAAAAAVASFEAQDGLRRTGALLLSTCLAAFAPGVVLTLAAFFRDVATIDPLWIFLGGFVYALSLLIMLVWLFLPAAYAGVSLIRDWMYGRPATDAFLWALMTVLFASVWFTDVYGGFPTLKRLGPATIAFLFAGSAGLGGLIGWLFYRLTGYPMTR